MLGVHANTVRAWTDQGRLRCLRINERGDRRYSTRDLEMYLTLAGRDAPDRAAVTGSAPPTGLSVALLRRVAGLCTKEANLAEILTAVAPILIEAGYVEATVVSAAGEPRHLVGAPELDETLVRRARREQRPLAGLAEIGLRTFALPLDKQVAADVMLLRRPEAATPSVHQELDFLAMLSDQLGAATAAAQRATTLEVERRRAHILQEINSDISSQLDLPRILHRLLGYTSELFGADHAAVLRRLPTGSFIVDHALDISEEFRQAIEHAPALPLTQKAFAEGRTVSATNYPDDPRGAALRRVLLREGVNTVTAAPLISDGELVGAMVMYHDQVHELSANDLALLEQLARMGAVALSNARNYSQMATWAAQLQSIQQLGARLTRLNSVRDIGQAITAELNQLIDNHNVRVYRLENDEVVPVAWRGEVGEYTGEDDAQLRTKVGQGITGWVARFGVAQYLPDASADRRTETIPGTEDDLDESLLVAPMLYEDEVSGVIVLAKLGLHQFTADDLRLLEIYASIAAQAMANADVTEKLRAQSEALARQLQGQRELLRVTESILSTLDATQLLDEIAVRLAALLQVDNVAVHLHDHESGLVRPLFARGIDADRYMAAPFRDDQGLSAHVLRSGAAELVQDMLTDERVVHFDDVGPRAGAVIIAPLRSRDRVGGLITIERLGSQANFGTDEFELVKLFAAHASVALRNAEAHRAVELRAETDPLTGLWNHGTLVETLTRAVDLGQPFGLLMIDLDGFKAYNDDRGHEAGNDMLKKLAGTLRRACRDADEIFRYGGDEFVVRLPATSVAGALRVAQKVRKAVRAANPAHGATRVTCSIGIAVYPLDGTDRASILQAADRACYAAKHSGRDRATTAAQAAQVFGDVEQPQAFGREPSDS